MTEDNIKKIFPELQKISIELLCKMADLSKPLLINSGLTHIEKDTCAIMLISLFLQKFLIMFEAFGKTVFNKTEADGDIYDRKEMLKYIYEQTLELIDGDEYNDLSDKLSKIKIRDLQ